LITSFQEALTDEDRTIITDLSKEYTVLLGYAVNKENACRIVEELQVGGISLAGSSEIRPGFKDYDELADILETLEVD
jgi:phosphoribosylanthranilate isomerase